MNTRWLILLFLLLLNACLFAQNRLFYAGGGGSESFYDVMQLSDGTILVAGVADDLDWLPAETAQIELEAEGIYNNQGTNRYPILLQLDSSLSTLLRVVHLPMGTAEDFRFIKQTGMAGAPTGALYLSGNTSDNQEGGYFVGRLDNNFVNGVPTRFEWVMNLRCSQNGYPKRYHPWDVDADGRVYYVRGDSHDWNWSSMHRLRSNGEMDVVENWRLHWKKSGGEYRNTPASAYEPGGSDSLSHSGIVFKRDGRCQLRSWTQEDYDLWQPDGNGGWKKGRWPLDVLFNSPCDPAGETPTSGPGYTGYRPAATFTYGPSAVVVDRRNGDCYLGLNMKSVLPGGNPDFEPAVMKMDSSGRMIWWSRLYHEVRPDSSMHNSTPDQYVDGLAIDYSISLPNSRVVVNARCHGNNVENFWEGNTLFHNPDADGFQRQFTGSSGNIHISWLGKLNTLDGAIYQSTYVAELAQGATGVGSPHTDPLMDGWPDPNSGWPTVNTTRLACNAITTTADGSVIVLGVGRRPLTTSNAYFKMTNPLYGGLSAWSSFVRQYDAELNRPLYSSIVRGVWDTLTAQPPSNVDLFGVEKLRNGVLVVGHHKGEGEDMPVTGSPTWGDTHYNGQDGVIGYFEAEEIFNPDDGAVGGGPVVPTIETMTPPAMKVFPNPASNQLTISPEKGLQRLTLYDLNGKIQRIAEGAPTLTLTGLPAGMYILEGHYSGGQLKTSRVVVTGEY
ncbi:MAG: T9SS type A sorting domain-containing protein [Phaeodactylibacter sp.]|nr:T9SS type A sorting domain-containing protein [Phaeodactylibacter sp.]